MRWRKIGKLFNVDNNFSWMVSHASNPFPKLLNDTIYRIYFSCRNQQNQSSIGYVDIDFNSPHKILNISNTPVLTPGEMGFFDDCGISIAQILPYKGKEYLYYIGWNVGHHAPFYNSIGLAIKDDEHYVKYSQAPIIDRCPIDPLTLSYPWVIKEGSLLKMWYGSHINWSENSMYHVIKYAESTNGIHWDKTGKIVIDRSNESEYAFSRPCVLKYQDLYRMWYTYRGDNYKIGYAESKNGIDWIRKDEVGGLEPTKDSSWDAESVCYPLVFECSNTLYMLYNGDNYGKTGFGLAILES